MRKDNLVHRSINVNGDTMGFQINVTILVLSYMLFLAFLAARL